MKVSLESWAGQIAEYESTVRAIALRRDSEAVELRRKATWALGRVPPGIDDERRARVLLDISRQILRIGDKLLNSVEPAALAVEAARASANGPLLREALTVQGVMLTELDNVHDAAVCLEEAWRIAERNPSDFKSMFSVLGNLGNALYAAYMYDDALKAFRRAEALARAAKLEMLRGQVLTNIALCALETRQFEDGLLAIREAINLMGTPHHTDECIARVFAEGHYVRLLLQFKRVVEARERVVFAKQYSAQSGSVRAELEAAAVEGLCDIFEGSMDIGRERVLTALERARAIPASTRTALLIAVQAFEASNEPGEALSYHREFSLMVKRQLRENILQYTKHQIITLSEQSPYAAMRMSDEHDKELRASYSQIVAQTGTEGFLLSQAMTAEADWDPDGGHIYRIGALAKRLADQLECEPAIREQIDKAARLHDLGMKTVPRSLKLKRLSLSREEQIEVQRHTVDGAELVGHSRLPYSSLAEDIARHHHERWDGKGYPDGLRGGGIPIAARIVALVDAFDTMTHEHVHQGPRSAPAALTHIESLLGTQFDPVAGKQFVAMVRAICAEHQDLDTFLIGGTPDTSLARTRAKLQRQP
jgi:HD-GYP domain-containing protein (c-di-GMP phosphodiesterase class II)